MKKNLILTLVFAVVCAFFASETSAQITINIPKLPKIKKSKPAETKQETPTVEPSKPTEPTESNVSRPTETEQNAGSQTAPDDKVCRDSWLGVHIDEINKRISDLEDFTPGRGWLVGTSTYNHLLFAVSPTARENWLTKSNGLEYKDCPNLIAAFDKLSALAEKKIPLYVPNKREYAIQTPALVKMMHSKIDDFADHKIFYSGVKEANWLIEKDSYNFPTARYKHGLVWVRYTKDQHPYCRIYFTNIIQDYAGGGTYGASYASVVRNDLAGCPAK